MEIAGREIGILGRVVHKLPAVALYPVISPVGRIGPIDFRLSGLFKKNLARKRFITDAYVKQAVICCPRTLEIYLFYRGTQTLVPQR
jgi:hypothetical protein